MTIRRQPEDFVVEEVVSAGFLGGLEVAAREGRKRGHDKSEAVRDARPTLHAVYRLRKTSLTTPEAVAWFAKGVGVKAGVVDYAGLKDKHAATVQMVSVPAEPGWEAAREVSGRGWSAEFMGWSERAVTAEVIEGNRFEIVVRDLSRGAAEEMEERARALSPGAEPAHRPAAGATLLIINYFGDQRFASARHGKGFAARHLLRGEFEEALKLLIATPARKDSGKTRVFTRVAAQMWGDWKGMLERLPRCAERGPIEALAAGKSFREAFAALPHFTQQMSVEAYQSLLWNRIAARLAARMVDEAHGHGRGGQARGTGTDEFGKMVFPAGATIGEKWMDASVPMLAPGTYLHEPWRGAAEEVLREEGVTLEELRVPGLRRPAFGEATRALVVEARGFEIGAIEADEMSRAGRVKRVVRFALPRGAYATVVLRALGQ